MSTTTKSGQRQSKARRPPLLPLRTFVILVVALVVGIAGGALTWLSAHSLPGAILVAGGTFGGALKLLHELVE
jgi:hypothetical protein